MGTNVTRSVLELRGFRRIQLLPDERKRVTFSLPVELLAYFDAMMQLSIEPATVQIMVGNSSPNLPLHGVITLLGAKRVLPMRRHYLCEVEVTPA